MPAHNWDHPMPVFGPAARRSPPPYSLAYEAVGRARFAPTQTSPAWMTKAFLDGSRDDLARSSQPIGSRGGELIV